MRYRSIPILIALLATATALAQQLPSMPAQVQPLGPTGGAIRQQPFLLPADGDLPGLRLGVMATLRLQGDTATAE